MEISTGKDHLIAGLPSTPAKYVSGAWPASVRLIGEGLHFHSNEDFHQTLFQSLGSDYASWWLERFLIGNSEKDYIALADLIEFSTENKKHSRLFSQIPYQDALVEAFRNFGFEEMFGGFGFQRSLTPSQETEAPLLKSYQALSEPILDIPDLRDPRIYIPHMGRGQSCYYSKASAIAEGEQDARCVIDYVNKYNKLIQTPSAHLLFEATLYPSIDSDSYSNCMRYCLSNGISENFISLLHSAFHIQRASNSRKGDLSLKLFDALLDRYISDHDSNGLKD